MVDQKGNSVTVIFGNPDGTITINDQKGNVTNWTRSEFIEHMAVLTGFLAENVAPVLLGRGQVA